MQDLMAALPQFDFVFANTPEDGGVWIQGPPGGKPGVGDEEDEDEDWGDKEDEDWGDWNYEDKENFGNGKEKNKGGKLKGRGKGREFTNFSRSTKNYLA